MNKANKQVREKYTGPIYGMVKVILYLPETFDKKRENNKA